MVSPPFATAKAGDDFPLRKVKSDPADAKKIARCTLDNWGELRKYIGMDTTSTQLKTLNTQFSFLMKQKVAAKANLIVLLDQSYPGVNKLFDSPTRADGSEKWVDYAYSFWHVDCIRKIGLKTFTERYRNFCKKHHYRFQPDKPEQLCRYSSHNGIRRYIFRDNSMSTYNCTIANRNTC